jgi:hypothetical protein
LGLDSCEVSADFASELERELAAAKAEVAKSNAERDEAVDALKRIATYDYRGNQSGESQIARHALIAMRKEGGAA